eukprot:7037349-Prymnesium_polylepis.1
MGRLVGELLKQADLSGVWTPGAFALIGAAAVLSGMTHMTLTLAAILTEVFERRAAPDHHHALAHGGADGRQPP